MDGFRTPGGGLLPDWSIERLSRDAATVQLAAGEWLFHERDAAESAFVVRSGRLEVLSEPDGLPIRIVKRGAMIGELALLTRTDRSASVRALCDSELLEIDRAAFERMLGDDGALAVSLCGVLAAQVAANRSPPAVHEPARTIALIALDKGVSVDALAERLGRSLAPYGRAAVVSARDVSGPAVSVAAEAATLVERALGGNRWVIMSAKDDPAAAWTRACLSEADRVVALSTGLVPRPWLTDASVLRGCELLVIGRSAPDFLLRALEPAVVQVLVDDPAIERYLGLAARRLTGRAVGIVLSGGGARAFAHIGVVEELRAAGVRIDRFGGASVGALIAAAYAMELTNDSALDAIRHYFVEEKPNSDYTLPVYAVLRGRRAQRLLAEGFGPVRIEELPTRFFAVSTDLTTRSLVVHRSGPVHEAVFASLAVPGMFPPVPAAHGRLLVDGGVLDNLPVQTMAQDAEGPVIAVDVGQVTGWVPARRGPEARWRAGVRTLIAGRADRLPTLTETLLRTMMIGSRDTVAAARRHADLVITPEVAGAGLVEFKQLSRMREAGRAAVRRLLESDPEALAPFL